MSKVFLFFFVKFCTGALSVNAVSYCLEYMKSTAIKWIHYSRLTNVIWHMTPLTCLKSKSSNGNHLHSFG